jgi:hypothetical protein
MATTAYENSDDFDNFGNEDFDSIQEKKRKRNEMESGRRQRLNEKFDELRDLVSGPSKRRKDILESSIETIYDLSEKINQLEQERVYYERLLPSKTASSTNSEFNDISQILKVHNIFKNIDYMQLQVFKQLQFPVAILSMDGFIEGVNTFFASAFNIPEENNWLESSYSFFRFLRASSLTCLYSSLSDLINFRCECASIQTEFDFNRIQTYFPNADQKQTESYSCIYVWIINQPMHQFLIMLN